MLLCRKVNLVKASNVRPHEGTKIAESIISPDLIAHESFSGGRQSHIALDLANERPKNSYEALDKYASTDP